ncbi:hypothetical protein ACQWU4_02110 [Chryseobacterium sp. MIQD13]|uniref:hypothetical protein n=1 Tax=Chryseobacterium sp. MIQD13 TaxID=3422310 RepID=UPI003D2C476A
MRNTKKVICLLIIIVNLNNLVKAQIGIGTAVPQKALHVTGTVSSTPVLDTNVNLVTPTVRIDGLNNTNQSITAKLRPVSVTDKGDLVLSHAQIIPIVMIDPINAANAETDYIGSTILNQTSTTTTTNAVMRSFSFVLSSPSIVKFGAVTSFQFRRASDGGVLIDGSNRIWGTRFRFSAAPSGVSTAVNAWFGESVHAYNNAVNNAGGTGILYANSEDTLFLPEGNYTIDINLYLSTESTQPLARIIYGAGSDTVNIVAYPIQ